MVEWLSWPCTQRSWVVNGVGEMVIPTFEGVVGKAGEGHKLIMAKAKTQAWLDKVKALYGDKDPALL